MYHTATVIPGLFFPFAQNKWKQSHDFSPDMSNSIETPIDIDFFGGIDIGIDIDSGYPWKIDIGIDIDFLNFERLTLALVLTFLSSMSMGNQNPLKLPV